MRDGELDIHFTNGHGEISTGSIHRDLLGMFRLREGDRPAAGLEFARLLFVVEIARLGNPENLLGCMLWLLSPASSFDTGITVPVDGGSHPMTGCRGMQYARPHWLQRIKRRNETHGHR